VVGDPSRLRPHTRDASSVQTKKGRRGNYSPSGWIGRVSLRPTCVEGEVKIHEAFGVSVNQESLA
jgi:hypothetical protein